MADPCPRVHHKATKYVLFEHSLQNQMCLERLPSQESICRDMDIFHFEMTFFFLLFKWIIDIIYKHIFNMNRPINQEQEESLGNSSIQTYQSRYWSLFPVCNTQTSLFYFRGTIKMPIGEHQCEVQRWSWKTKYSRNIFQKIH